MHANGERTARFPLRTVVIDPFPLLRRMIANLLIESRVAEVVGEADCLRSGIAICEDLSPDLVITDVGLADQWDGLKLCRSVKNLPDPPLVLIFSGANDPQIISQCVSSGADSFVHRSAEPPLVLNAIKTLADAQPLWFMGKQGETAEAADRYDTEELAATLTKREQDVLVLLLCRYSNDEIAAKLFLARQTVKNYVSSVLQKLGYANRRELLAGDSGKRFAGGLDVIAGMRFPGGQECFCQQAG